jgi:hypothetical protein
MVLRFKPAVGMAGRKTSAWLGWVALFGVAFSGGCHSAYVSADVRNATGAPVTLVEVDYPSASFGTETLAAGADFHYRFKIQGSGPAKVLWTDAGHKDHTVTGPELQEGQQGSLLITISEAGATWSAQLHR